MASEPFCDSLETILARKPNLISNVAYRWLKACIPCTAYTPVKIKLPAVKITGDASQSSTLIQDAKATSTSDTPTPDPVVSSEMKTTTAPPSPKASAEIVPTPVSPSSVDQQCAASSLFVEEIDQEDEMGAFLLDAVEWL